MNKDVEIGEKIKRLRVTNNLTQEELAERTELSKGFISQVERNLASPSIQTLVDILEALGTNLTDFFQEPVDEKVVFTEDEHFESVHEELGYTIDWIIPDAQGRAMEPIRISLPEGAKTKTYGPHEAEEFGYVMQGQILLHVNEKKHVVKKGETFYLRKGMKHYFENIHKTVAQVLWVSNPPIF